MSKIIGLTGPSGAGKSYAARVCADLGVKHIDCDILARRAVEKGTKGLNAVINAFGNNILNTDGTLNRKALAEKAFHDKNSTELLNKTLLPFIKELVLAEIEGEWVLLDAPTLFESGINEICFKTIAVLSDTDKRLLRIMARDNIAKDAALLRIKAGKKDEFYIENCDFIIYNNKDVNTFNNEFLCLLKEIMV